MGIYLFFSLKHPFKKKIA